MQQTCQGLITERSSQLAGSEAESITGQRWVALHARLDIMLLLIGRAIHHLTFPSAMNVRPK